MPDHSEMTHTEVLSDIWFNLAEGVKHGAHPFHTPALANAFEQDPDVRTVVLRRVDENQRQIIFHTDIRSPKVSMLRTNPRVAWLFYDREAKVQLRLYGSVSIHTADGIAATRWKDSTKNSKQCYLTPDAPGSALSVQSTDPSGANDGYENFAVISCDVSAIDWLSLRAGGHLRARFDWSGDGWNGKWIAP